MASLTTNTNSATLPPSSACPPAEWRARVVQAQKSRLDPEVQARMQNIEFLGSFTVLDLQKLDSESREIFDLLPSTPALPKIDDLGQTLLEPHSSWMTFLTQEWAKRYTR